MYYVVIENVFVTGDHSLKKKYPQTNDSRQAQLPRSPCLAGEPRHTCVKTYWAVCRAGAIISAGRVGLGFSSGG